MIKKYYREYGGVIKSETYTGFNRKNYFIPIKENIKKIKEKYDNTDVYITPYIYTNPKDIENSMLYSPFYLDLDIKLTTSENYEIVKNDAINVLDFLMEDLEIPEEFIKIYYSGNKGFHFIIHPIIFEIKPSKTLNIDFKLFAAFVKRLTGAQTIDTVIYDNKRLFRLPNTINSKSGHYKVRINKSILENYDYEDMKAYSICEQEDINIPINSLSPIKKASDYYHNIIKAEKIKAISSTNKNSSKRILDVVEKLPQCIVHVTDTGVPEGMRNNTTVLLASAFFQAGCDLQETTEWLINWNAEKNELYNETEIRNTTISAYRMYNNGQGYGCSSFKSLGTCICDECPYYKRR